MFFFFFFLCIFILWASENGDGFEPRTAAWALSAFCKLGSWFCVSAKACALHRKSVKSACSIGTTKNTYLSDIELKQIFPCNSTHINSRPVIFSCVQPVTRAWWAAISSPGGGTWGGARPTTTPPTPPTQPRLPGRCLPRRPWPSPTPSSWSWTSTWARSPSWPTAATWAWRTAVCAVAAPSFPLSRRCGATVRWACAIAWGWWAGRARHRCPSGAAERCGGRWARRGWRVAGPWGA